MFLECVFLLVGAYKFKCPHISQRQPRIFSVCNGTVKEYTCLYDTSNDGYVEFCSTKNDYVRPGQKYVRSGTFRNVQCSDGRFQPFRFWSNKDTDCIFTKTNCDDIGQVIHDNSSTQQDATCRCDYRKGYTFLVQPSNLCFCNPTVEDCSCNIKWCINTTTLSSDYECLPLNIMNRKNVCQPIIDSKANSTELEIRHKDSMQFGTLRKCILFEVIVSVIGFAVTSGIVILCFDLET